MLVVLDESMAAMEALVDELGSDGIESNEGTYGGVCGGSSVFVFDFNGLLNRVSAFFLICFCAFRFVLSSKAFSLTFSSLFLSQSLALFFADLTSDDLDNLLSLSISESFAVPLGVLDVRERPVPDVSMSRLQDELEEAEVADDLDKAYERDVSCSSNLTMCPFSSSSFSSSDLAASTE